MPAIWHKRRKVRRQFPAIVSFEPIPVQNQYLSLILGQAWSALTTNGGSGTYTGTPVFCMYRRAPDNRSTAQLAASPIRNAEYRGTRQRLLGGARSPGRFGRASRRTVRTPQALLPFRLVRVERKAQDRLTTLRFEKRILSARSAYCWSICQTTFSPNRAPMTRSARGVARNAALLRLQGKLVKSSNIVAQTGTICASRFGFCIEPVVDFVPGKSSGYVG